jgi:hypothetical protein
MTLLRGLRSHRARVPPGRSSRRHSLTCRQSRQAGRHEAANATSKMLHDGSLWHSQPPYACDGELAGQPYQALDGVCWTLVHHILRCYQVEGGVRQP